MSRSVTPITLLQFSLVLKLAQDIHSQKEEPIPEITSYNIPKIDAALNQPFQTFDGQELYRSFVCKAAIMFYLIINNHVLINGNKRMACLLLGYFCHINGYQFFMPAKLLRKLAKDVASPHEETEMLRRVQENIRKYLAPYKRKGFR